MGVLTDLKARGVQDILITCTDNLNGFTETIRSVFPNSSTQICVVHQIRNSCKYVVFKDKKEFTPDIKNIYNAPIKEMAAAELDHFEEKWGVNLLMQYSQGERTGMIWLYSSSSQWKLERLSIPRI